MLKGPHIIYLNGKICIKPTVDGFLILLFIYLIIPCLLKSLILKIGEKPYVCDICGSRHTRKGELLLHVRCIHTHERPFQCAYCPKNFQRRDLLRKHERIHTDTRPYGKKLEQIVFKGCGNKSL